MGGCAATAQCRHGYAFRLHARLWLLNAARNGYFSCCLLCPLNLGLHRIPLSPDLRNINDGLSAQLGYHYAWINYSLCKTGAQDQQT